MNAPREVALAQAFIESGFRKLVFILPQAGPEILHELDQIAALAAQLRAMSL